MDAIDWHEWFYYDGANLIWKKPTGLRVMVGDIAGNNIGNGYRCLTFRGKRYCVHRIIWEMHNGPIPEGYQVDHIDHDRLNNSLDNLRLVTCQENAKNRSIQRNNTSGYTGFIGIN